MCLSDKEKSVFGFSIIILMNKKTGLWAQFCIKSIDFIDSIDSIDSIEFLHFMKISQTINTIIQHVSFIIKTRQRNFTNIVSSNFMQFTVNPFYFLSYKTFIKRNTNILFMSYAFNNIFIDSFCFFNIFTIHNNKRYIFHFNPTNSLIIFPETSFLILPIIFLMTGSKIF